MYATTSGDGGIIPIQIFNNFAPNSTNYEIKLTGKQGDVMKESVHCSLTAAIEYIKRDLHKNPSKYTSFTNFDNYLNDNFKHGFHVHAPATSTPKDGPSAGCAFTSAFISRILDKPIKEEYTLSETISDDERYLEVFFKNEHQKEVLGRLLNNLSKQQKLILTYYFGLDGNEPMDTKEIANVMGVTASSILGIKNKAFRILRMVMWRRKLNSRTLFR